MSATLASPCLSSVPGAWHFWGARVRPVRARPSTLPPDPQLVASLRAGDGAVFRLLLDSWSASMLRVARGFVRSADVAEEVVQDTWAAVIKGVDRFEGRSSLKTWVYTILANRARSRAVREARTLPFSALASDSDEPVDADQVLGRGGHGATLGPFPERGPEGAAFDRAALGALRVALESLPASQMTVVVLRDVEGLESVDVCALLDISAANQRVLLHRGRARLRAALVEHAEAP